MVLSFHRQLSDSRQQEQELLCMIFNSVQTRNNMFYFSFFIQCLIFNRFVKSENKYLPLKVRIACSNCIVQFSNIKRISVNLASPHQMRGALPSRVSHRAMAPQISSKMIITMRLMIAAVVFTTARTLYRAAGQSLRCSAVFMLIRYKMTPKTMAKVTAI